MGRSHLISNWDPEDTVAWEAGNKKVPPQPDLVSGRRARGVLDLVYLVGDGAVHADVGVRLLASYLVAALLTWIMYVRKPFSAAGVPQTKTERELARV